MTSSDLSVPELARMTGLDIDPSWDCASTVSDGTRSVVLCSSEWQANSLLGAAASNLPVGNAVRVEFRRGDAMWDAEWPLSFDLHWLREITPGFPLGVRPVRVHSESPMRASACLQGDFVTLIWRTFTGEARVQVALLLGDTVPRLGLKSTELSPLAMPTEMDEVLRALTGSTSVEWLRGVFAESCSLRWKDIARRIGARPDQLDDLAVYFAAVTTTEEDALWRAASTMGDLVELTPWLESLASEQPNSFEDLLHDTLHRVGHAFWRSPAGEWLNAVAGGATSCLTSPEIVAHLAESARIVLSLLVRDDLAKLMVRLRAAADEEWAAFAPWYRARIEESCGALSADLGSDRVMQEVSLWIKKLYQRLQVQSIEAARQRAQAALSAAIATADSSDANWKVLVDLALAGSPCGDELVARIASGDLRPCFALSVGSSSVVQLFNGGLGDLQGRRISIEVLMPFLQKKSWTTAREALATAEIRQTGDGQLAIAGSGGTEERSVERESAELLLSAVFTSRTEAPADDMIHLVHESRRTLQGNECDVAWLRMVRAYGLSVPRMPSGPCEATVRIEVPWNAAEAWYYAPLKRDAGYIDKFLHLSLTMQEMARHWLPALWLSTAQQFASPNAVLPLLVYAASRPQANRRRAEFGYDAMSPFRVEQAAASAVGKLPELLDPFYRSLKASGRSEIAEFYAPDRAHSIICAVQRKPRALAALLAGDTFFLEHCFQLTTLCRELRSVAGRNPAQALRKLAQASDEIVKASMRGIKRHYPNLMHQGLGAVYLLEATRALAAVSGKPGFRASLTASLITDTGTKEQRFEAAA